MDFTTEGCGLREAEFDQAISLHLRKLKILYLAVLISEVVLVIAVFGGTLAVHCSSREVSYSQKWQSGAAWNLSTKVGGACPQTPLNCLSTSS